MMRTPDLRRRDQLLAAVVADAAASGIGDRSLRDIAAAVGTSHRMLLHYFGSRNDLMIAIVEDVERRQRMSMVDLPTKPSEAVAAMWATLRAPELRPLERLFFECYSRGAQGEEPFDRMLPRAVDDWLAAASGRWNDPALTRLGLAVIRGLLLDLVATEDASGVDAAAAAFVDVMRSASIEAAGQQPSSVAAPRRRRSTRSVRKDDPRGEECSMATHLQWTAVTIDCANPARLALFWGALLDRDPEPGRPGWAHLVARGDDQPRLNFQPVAEPKRDKVRIHLDLTVDDLDRAIQRVLDLGGRDTAKRHEYPEGTVVVLEDPEGNEFCIVHYTRPAETR